MASIDKVGVGGALGDKAKAQPLGMKQVPKQQNH